MNWAWASSLDQLWRSPTVPMWLTLAAAVFFAVIVLLTLLRAEKSVANGALTVITLLAIAVAGAATIRGFGPAEQAGAVVPPPRPVVASLPALSCLDELAGETVLAACEKVLFGSAEASSAAVSYAAAKIDRLTAYGDVAAANKVMTPDLMALRRAVERDRYGLVAYVLQTRDRCQLADCPVSAALTDRNQIAANMEEHAYEGLIGRYAPAWNAPPPAVTGALAGLVPSVPTGKPTTADFPSAASIPPINIMTPEPPLTPRGAPPANAQTPRPAAAANASAGQAPAAAKKQAAPKARAPAPVQSAPVQLAPPAAAPDN
jgi:hypothetical protein